MPSLVDVPLEVLIDNLLPYLPLPSIAALASSSRDLAALCADDTFWKRKLQEDYNFSDTSTAARTSGGYRFLYRGFHRAKLYVWGSAGNGRLGIPRISGGRPYPAKLDIPGARIVELAAGGWSFHALDAQGCVHVWGQLDGIGMGLNVDSFALPTKRVIPPLKLALPEKITQISCGRSHAAALSVTHRIWVFTAWGMPYVVTSPLLASPASSPPRQVECGWDFIAVLTEAGDVHVWWPFHGDFGGRTEAHRAAVQEQGPGPGDQGGVIQCRTWELDARPEQVRDVAGELLPSLGGEDELVGQKIVKIAAGDNFLIALTEGGHVLRTDFLQGHESFGGVQRPRWEYLPLFSEVTRVREHPEFKKGTLAPPDKMHITHITANFTTFFAYSTGASSIVLQGKQERPPPAEPDIPYVIPALQHRGVISVVVGDYHFGALTETGTLLTWGGYSSGALGLGNPSRLPLGAPGGFRTGARWERPANVLEPAEVRFGTKGGPGPGRKTFVFMTAAAGWHMGALVIDLEEGEEEEEEEEESEPPHRHLFRMGI